MHLLSCLKSVRGRSWVPSITALKRKPSKVLFNGQSALTSGIRLARTFKAVCKSPFPPCFRRLETPMHRADLRGKHTFRRARSKFVTAHRGTSVTPRVRATRASRCWSTAMGTRFTSNTLTAPDSVGRSAVSQELIYVLRISRAFGGVLKVFCCTSRGTLGVQGCLKR